MADIVPNPLISRGVPAYSETNPSTASAANDEHYYSFWSGTAPDKLAYDLSEIPEKQRKTVIAVWYTTSTFDKVGSYASQNMIPTDYTVEVNAAEIGCIVSGADEKCISIADRYIEEFGAAFQILDDLSDYRAGKKENSSYVNLYGESKTISDIYLHITNAGSALYEFNTLGYDTGVLAMLLDFLLTKVE